MRTKPGILKMRIRPAGSYKFRHNKIIGGKMKMNWYEKNYLMDRFVRLIDIYANKNADENINVIEKLDNYRKNFFLEYYEEFNKYSENPVFIHDFNEVFIAAWYFAIALAKIKTLNSN